MVVGSASFLIKLCQYDCVALRASFINGNVSYCQVPTSKKGIY